jgi:hypothetical protein
VGVGFEERRRGRKESWLGVRLIAIIGAVLMRLNYYGYYIKDESTGNKYLHDLRDFFKAYCSKCNIEFKKQFKYADEHIYLFNSIGDMYLFITTRSNEVIKKIDENLGVNEIYSMLSANEHLGFASYVFLRKDFFCFASTIFAPKLVCFQFYINEIFKKIGLETYKFIINPMMHQSSRNEIMRMPFIGRTTFEINKESSFWGELKAIVTASNEDTQEFDSFEITIKPNKKQNIAPLVKKFMDKIPDAGMEKFITKAKEESEGALTELYLMGKGAICDSIFSKHEPVIHEKIATKISENKILKSKIEEFRRNGYTPNTPDDLRRYNDDDSWANILLSIQNDNSEQYDLNSVDL